jgi:hypothetical protein
MIFYSKLHGLLTGKNNKVGTPSFGLKCTIQNLFSKDEELRYIHFQTENNINCLLYINPDIFQIQNDTNKKFIEIKRWYDHEYSFGTILSPEENITLTKEVKVNTLPHEFINLLKTISLSLQFISYKAAVITEEYLITQNYNDEQVDVFNINGPKEPKLLIVVDLKTLLKDVSVSRIEKTYTELMKLLHENNEKYWINLNKLLHQCQTLKILTNGKKMTNDTSILILNVQLLQSQKAIDSALNSLNMKP